MSDSCARCSATADPPRWVVVDYVDGVPGAHVTGGHYSDPGVPLCDPCADELLAWWEREPEAVVDPPRW